MNLLASEKDFTTSVKKALSDIDPKWDSYPGLIVAGTHAPSLLDEKLKAIEEARKGKTPFLGICWGMQLAVIEYARNSLQLSTANSTEIDPDTTAPVIDKMNGLRVGIRKVGDRMESFWHNYKFNDLYIEAFKPDWHIKRDEEGLVAELRHKEHYFFKGVAFHPEYQSTKRSPHPLFVEFINACRLAKKIL